MRVIKKNCILFKLHEDIGFIFFFRFHCTVAMLINIPVGIRSRYNIPLYYEI